MLNDLLGNRWVALGARWVLGATFIAASYHKMVSPAEFAKILFGYNLFPGETINLIAVILPFVELVAGTALVAGVWVRPAAAIITGLLGAFIVLVFVNILRGHVYDCGCFSAGNSGSASNPWVTLARNLALLMAACLVLKSYSHRGKRASASRPFSTYVRASLKMKRKGCDQTHRKPL